MRKLSKREKVNKWARDWRSRNRKKVSESNRRRYLNNHEERKAYDRLRYKENKIAIQERQTLWRSKNIQKWRHYEHLRRYKKISSEGTHTFGEWELLKKQYGYKCPSCEEAGVKLTEDHIIPLSKGGSDFIENIQPLCRSCNSRKGNRIIIKY